MRIIETDNLGRDYPDERFIAIDIPDERMADIMCDALVAKYSSLGSHRYYRVVPDDYVLQPGFEP